MYSYSLHKTKGQENTLPRAAAAAPAASLTHTNYMTNPEKASSQGQGHLGHKRTQFYEGARGRVVLAATDRARGYNLAPLNELCL